jgi:DNA polymerase-1
MSLRPILYLLDGHSLAYRAYHAFNTGRKQLTTSSGEPIGAVFGFAKNLMDILEKYNPKYIAVTFDDGLSGRDQLYPAYKAHRPDAPQDFEPQVRQIERVVRAFNIPVLTLPGYEADDLIGTVAAQAESLGADVRVISGDGDILQLLSPHTTVQLRVRRKNEGGRFVVYDIIYDEAQFEREYGFKPPQLIDFKALKGDSSDNIPGVAGIGEKTATQLIQTYGSLENLYDHLGEIKGANQKKLADGRDSAFLSQRLATIQRDVPVQIDLAACLADDFHKDAVESLFRELEFASLIRQLDKLYPEKQQQLTLFDMSDGEPVAAALVDTVIVDDDESLAGLVAALNSASAIAFDTETTGTDQMRAELVGISLSTNGERGYYIPVGHREGRQLPLAKVIEALRPPLTNPAIGKYAHNAGYDLVVLQRYGIEVTPITFDTMIAEWLRDPASVNLGLKNLTLIRLGERMTEIKALIGKGSDQTTMDAVSIDKAAPYAAADAVFTHRLVHFRKDKDSGALVEQGLHWELAQDAALASLFETLEMPLVPVIAAIERAGVLLDRDALATMSTDLTAQLADLEREIHALDGVGEFNINSPQQLSKILFDQLGLPVEGISKTAYGYSTAAHVLEDLRDRSDQPIPIIDKLLKYRELSKLKGTYVDALPELINPQTGRVHTSFNQTGASTGRLSSSNPNLQNIPVRTEQGREVRRAFIAPDNMVLLSVDYSQIELRVVAHISREPALLDAFAHDQDIHATTAALVYNVPLDEVTKLQRNFAKRVNFGILYGMGAFRLARDSELTFNEADEFIKTYLRRLPGVQQYIEDTKAFAREKGYVQTLFGRKRAFPELQRGGSQQRQRQAEREAINMPIQGTAADIIKRAMIDLYNGLTTRGLKGRMILQVHDELVLEVPTRELDETAALVVSIMEGVTLPDGTRFDPRLRANAQFGTNWLDMETWGG